MRLCIPLLLLAACAAPDTDTPAAVAPPPLHRIVVRSEALLPAVVAAADAWTDATGGAVQWDISLRDVCPVTGALCVKWVDTMPPCGPEAAAPGSAWACTDLTWGMTLVHAPDGVLLGTLEHELGHYLGLGHDVGGIMTPNRTLSQWAVIGAAASGTQK